MFVNSHIHIFHGIKDVPDRFFGRILMMLLRGNKSFQVVAKILHSLNPFSNKDEFDRYLSFAKTGRLPGQKEIFEKVLEQYPSDTKFVILPMDMAYMAAGYVDRDYKDQLIELTSVRNAYPNNIIPFMAVDCRRPGVVELFKQAVEIWKFKGVKLYPPLGTFPYDSGYFPIYKYCQERGLPIIAHCTSGNPVFYKGKKKDLLELLKDSKLPVDPKKSNKELCANFTHPSNYTSVMDMFSNLKVCLAHFGRESEWDLVILKMMDKYSNLYVDCSYTMAEEKYWPMMKLRLLTNPQLRQRLMFGSDYYMNEVECTERQFCINFRVFLGEELWNQIAVINPQKFLETKNLS